MAGSAVATMVWSTTARNIGSMIEKKMRKNGVRAGAGGRGSPRGGVAGGVAGGLADESAGGPAGGAGSLGGRGLGRSGDTKAEGLFSPCNHSQHGAVRRGGFGTRQTILLPFGEHTSEIERGTARGKERP